MEEGRHPIDTLTNITSAGLRSQIALLDCAINSEIMPKNALSANWLGIDVKC